MNWGYKLEGGEEKRGGIRNLGILGDVCNTLFWKWGDNLPRADQKNKVELLGVVEDLFEFAFNVTLLSYIYDICPKFSITVKPT